jgi:hypothetical protein
MKNLSFEMDRKWWVISLPQMQCFAGGLLDVLIETGLTLQLLLVYYL